MFAKLAKNVLFLSFEKDSFSDVATFSIYSETPVCGWESFSFVSLQHLKPTKF
jgi:hypothetical protein